MDHKSVLWYGITSGRFAMLYLIHSQKPNK